MPPHLVPQFFIGLESQKDGWAYQLKSDEKDFGREQGKGRVTRN